jgi:hypothetical protein
MAVYMEEIYEELYRNENGNRFNPKDVGLGVGRWGR